jgi:DNA-directed RNA polymerase specialized sigma24 family protein
MRQHWELTGEAFENLLAFLHPDRDTAGAVYLRLRAKLAKFFEYNGVPNPDDLADEVLDRLTRRITEGQSIQNVDAFAYGIARLVLVEFRRSKLRQGRALSALLYDLEIIVDDRDLELRHHCLTHCLAQIMGERSEVLLEYFGSGSTGKRELAARLNISENALRLLVFNSKPKLKKCVENCLNNNSIK